jgi:hypothetical protein
VVLAVAAIGFGIGVYYLLDYQELQEFSSQFESYARETAEIAETNAENTFGQFRTLATAITSHALLDNGGSFPNVLIPFFDIKVAQVANLTGAEMILWVPLVEQEHRAEYELDWMSKQASIELDYRYRGWETNDLDPISKMIYECDWCSSINDTRKGYVNDGFMEEVMESNNYTSEGLSAPVAQYGPALIDSSLVNFDLYSHPTFKKEIVASVDYDVPVISETIDLSFLLKHVAVNYTDEPRSFTLFEVYEDFSPGAKAVGYIVGVLPWSKFFTNPLPPDINGLVVELHSDCGRNLTYVFNGGKNDTWEEGSGHDKKYKHMEIRTKFFWKDHPKGLSRHCHFDLVMFPSDELRYHYQSSQPMIYAALVLVIFVFTALVFFIFNWYMSQRQAEAEEEAAKAISVVNSVFPEQIGERLLAEAKEKKDSEKFSKKNQLSSFIDSSKATSPGAGNSQPLADLFLSTTVLFADIAGFTAWSSTREPSQVFRLLESLYFQFDRVAQKRGIFKVETIGTYCIFHSLFLQSKMPVFLTKKSRLRSLCFIGDCYVAVAGLPTPRADHHVAMARFARDIMETMAHMTQQLEVELGPDTSSLGLRIGLHSGPVTAGTNCMPMCCIFGLFVCV